MMAPAIRYEQARDLLEAALTHKAQSEIVPLSQALGRIAAQSYHSEINLPQTRNSAVDGYAVSSAELAKNQEALFKLVGEAKAGHPFEGNLAAGEALRIFTGAIMPDEADSVLMEEFCTQEGGFVRFGKALSAGKNCRPAGENLAIGEEIVAQGTILTPAHIGQATAAGLTDISVTKPLRIGVISTGDELVDKQQSPQKLTGQIYDSNRPMILALCIAEGHEVIDGGIIADDEAALSKAYHDLAAQCDVVISSGGASAGAEDHTQAALLNNGATPLFWRLAIKPGRPVAASMLGDVPIVCLPGNPVAVYVCFHLLVVPALHKLAHGTFKPLKKLMIKSGFAHEKKPNERAEFVRVKLALTKEGETVMVPHGRKGAGVLSSLTQADGLAELPFETSAVSEGQKLPFIML